MTKWEYTIMQVVSGDPQKSEFILPAQFDKLTALGNEGWEIISVNHQRLLFDLNKPVPLTKEVYTVWLKRPVKE